MSRSFLDNLFGGLTFKVWLHRRAAVFMQELEADYACCHRPDPGALFLRLELEVRRIRKARAVIDWLPPERDHAGHYIDKVHRILLRASAV